MTRIKRYAEIGSPWRQPRRIGKEAVNSELTMIEADICEFKSRKHDRKNRQNS